MKKFNLVLLVLVAALFGSSLVACNHSAGYSGFDDPETPAESYIEAVYSSDGCVVTFIPVPDCNTVDEVHTQYERASDSQFNLNFDSFTEGLIVKNRIITSDSYRFNKYIVLRYNDGSSLDEIYELDIADTTYPLKATAPISAR